MLDDISGGGWLIIVCAFGLGFVMVRLVVVGTKDKRVPVEPEARHAQTQGATAEPASRSEASPQRPESTEHTAHWTDVLELAAHASAQDIHAAYQRKMAQYHPDKVAHLGPELQVLAEQMAKRINRAYDEALLERE